MGTAALAVSVSIQLDLVTAHEGHQMECSEMGMNALTADIQAMDDGDGKTTAMNELEMAQQMMAKSRRLWLTRHRPSGRQAAAPSPE